MITNQANSSTFSASQLVEAPCFFCNKIYRGVQIPPEDLKLVYSQDPYTDVFKCQHCSTYICMSCRTKAKWSWWSGWGKVKCPNCRQLFGQGNQTLIQESVAKKIFEKKQTLGASPEKSAQQNEGFASEEVFRTLKPWKVKCFFSTTYPALMLLIMFIMWVTLVLPSQDSVVVWQVKPWAPFAALALVIWFSYQLKRTKEDLRFSVALSEDKIRVGKITKSWGEIQRAEIKFGLGRDPIIILYAKSGDQIKIPGIIEGINYIKTFVERHVKDVSKPKN